MISADLSAQDISPVTDVQLTPGTDWLEVEWRPLPCANHFVLSVTARIRDSTLLDDEDFGEEASASGEHPGVHWRKPGESSGTSTVPNLLMSDDEDMDDQDVESSGYYSTVRPKRQMTETPEYEDSRVQLIVDEEAVDYEEGNDEPSEETTTYDRDLDTELSTFESFKEETTSSSIDMYTSTEPDTTTQQFEKVTTAGSLEGETTTTSLEMETVTSLEMKEAAKDYEEDTTTPIFVETTMETTPKVMATTTERTTEEGETTIMTTVRSLVDSVVTTVWTTVTATTQTGQAKVQTSFTTMEDMETTPSYTTESEEASVQTSSATKEAVGTTPSYTAEPEDDMVQTSFTALEDVETTPSYTTENGEVETSLATTEDGGTTLSYATEVEEKDEELMESSVEVAEEEITPEDETSGEAMEATTEHLHDQIGSGASTVPTLLEESSGEADPMGTEPSYEDLEAEYENPEERQESDSWWGRRRRRSADIYDLLREDDYEYENNDDYKEDIDIDVSTTTIMKLLSLEEETRSGGEPTAVVTLRVDGRKTKARIEKLQPCTPYTLQVTPSC